MNVGIDVEIHIIILIYLFVAAGMVLATFESPYAKKMYYKSLETLVLL